MKQMDMPLVKKAQDTCFWIGKQTFITFITKIINTSTTEDFEILLHDDSQVGSRHASESQIESVNLV